MEDQSILKKHVNPILNLILMAKHHASNKVLACAGNQMVIIKEESTLLGKFNRGSHRHEYQMSPNANDFDITSEF